MCSDLETAAADGRRVLADVVLSLATQALEEAGFDVSRIPQFALLDPRMFLLGNGLPSAFVSPPQIVYSRTDARARPDRIKARTDERGILTLPGLGSFETSCPNGELSVGLNPDACLSVVEPGAETAILIRRAVAVRTGDLEITDPRDCYLARFLDRHVPGRLDLIANVDPFARDLDIALELVREAAPSFYAALLTNVREAVLFCHPALESFTALAFHGAIFINVETARNSIVRLLADVAHQCAHVVLSAATPDRSLYFLGDPDGPFDAGTGEGRSIYDTLHGLFTATVEHAVLVAATSLLEERHDAGSEIDPMIARLSRIFERDYEGVIAAKLLSTDGERLIHRFANCFR